MAIGIRLLLCFCCLSALGGFCPVLRAQSALYTLRDRLVAKSEKTAFVNALKIFDPSGKYQTEDAKLFGGLRLGMPEAEFRAVHPETRRLNAESSAMYTVYVHDGGIRYEFFAGRLFGISATISLKVTGDVGLDMAKQRYQEYLDRGKKLFGESYTESNDRRRDPNAAATVWTVWRDGQKNALQVRVSCPDRPSKKASRDDLHARIIVCDQGANEALNAPPEEVRTRLGNF